MARRGITWLLGGALCVLSSVALAKGPLLPDDFGDAQLRQALDGLHANYARSAFIDGTPYYYVSIPDTVAPKTAAKNRHFFVYADRCKGEDATQCLGIHLSFHDPLPKESLVEANDFNAAHGFGHVTLYSDYDAFEEDQIAAAGVTIGNLEGAITGFVTRAMVFLSSRAGQPMAGLSPAEAGALASSLQDLRMGFGPAESKSQGEIPAAEKAFIETVHAARH